MIEKKRKKKKASCAINPFGGELLGFATPSGEIKTVLVSYLFIDFRQSYQNLYENLTKMCIPCAKHESLLALPSGLRICPIF